MNADIAVDTISHSLRLVMLIVAVLVVPGMLVGLLVGLFQAATQINEQTLSFLPRLMMTLLAIALAGLLGYAFPVRPWRWAAVVMLMQVVVMLFGSSGFGLLPAGLLLLTVLTLPAIALAQLAAWVRRRADG